MLYCLSSETTSKLQPNILGNPWRGQTPKDVLRVCALDGMAPALPTVSKPMCPAHCMQSWHRNEAAHGQCTWLSTWREIQNGQDCKNGASNRIVYFKKLESCLIFGFWKRWQNFTFRIHNTRHHYLPKKCKLDVCTMLAESPSYVQNGIGWHEYTCRIDHTFG